MSELSAHRVEQKKDWTLTEGAFHRLLLWLDEGAQSDGRRYLEMRRRLVAYFDRKNCPAPDELADETLNRVARRLEEEGGGLAGDDPPAKYCYIVARFVFMEYLRRSPKDHLPLEELKLEPRAHDLVAADEADEATAQEKRLQCLERCVGGLEPRQRRIIMEYYMGRERAKIENRRALAESLGISINALSIRACRIREKLEICVTQCVGGGG